MAKKVERPRYRCRDCKHSYDWHEKGANGQPFLCRCKLDERTEFGKWCKFLTDLQCKHFELKQE